MVTEGGFLTAAWQRGPPQLFLAWGAAEIAVNRLDRNVAHLQRLGNRLSVGPLCKDASCGSDLEGCTSPTQQCEPALRRCGRRGCIGVDARCWGVRQQCLPVRRAYSPLQVLLALGGTTTSAIRMSAVSGGTPGRTEQEIISRAVRRQDPDVGSDSPATR